MKREVGILMELTVQKAARDPYYKQVLDQYRRLDSQLQKTIQQMDPNQRAVVDGYCAVTGELYRLVLECACTEIEEMRRALSEQGGKSSQ